MATDATATGTPQVGEPTQQGQVPTTPSASSDNVQVTPPSNEDAAAKIARLEKENADTRKEAASWRTKVRGYEQAEEERKTASLSDVERATNALEAEKARSAKTREKLAALAVQNTAQTLGIVDPEVALALISSQLEYDDDGLPTNVSALLADLLTRKPYLGAAGAGTQQQGPNAGNVGAPARSSTGVAMITPKQFSDYGFHKAWEVEHKGQTLGAAVMSGQVRVTG